MPRYLKDGKKLPNVRTEKAWITVPVKVKKHATTPNTEIYLVQPRVAEYIEKLESKIKGDLPKLPIK